MWKKIWEQAVLLADNRERNPSDAERLLGFGLRQTTDGKIPTADTVRQRQRRLSKNFNFCHASALVDNVCALLQSCPFLTCRHPHPGQRRRYQRNL